MSWSNDTVELNLIIPQGGDGYIIHLIPDFDASWYSSSIDEWCKYERELPVNVLSGGNYTDYSMPYSWVGGSVISLKISVYNGNLSIYINDTCAVAFNVTVPGATRLVVDALTRSYSTGVRSVNRRSIYCGRHSGSAEFCYRYLP